MKHHIDRVEHTWMSPASMMSPSTTETVGRETIVSDSGPRRANNVSQVSYLSSSYDCVLSYDIEEVLRGACVCTTGLSAELQKTRNSSCNIVSGGHTACLEAVSLVCVLTSKSKLVKYTLQPKSVIRPHKYVRYTGNGVSGRQQSRAK